MKLSVVIPAYNEEKDIKSAIFDVVKAFPHAEIIVVDDSSTDNTPIILKQLQKEIKNLKVISNFLNEGHGRSVIKGLKEAQGDYVLYVDADRQINIDNLLNIQEGYDFISGWRLQRSDKLFRKVISFCLKTTNFLWHWMYIKDANCPFKLYKRSSLNMILDELPKTYIIPIACLEVLARKHNFKTLTIPTPHLPYQGTRVGFLQVPDLKAWKFFASAFFEIIKL